MEREQEQFGKRKMTYQHFVWYDDMILFGHPRRRSLGAGDKSRPVVGIGGSGRFAWLSVTLPTLSLRSGWLRPLGCDPHRGLLVCGRQSGRTSAPLWPQAVQIMRGPSER
jgi:hypothetical protein